VLHHRQAPPAGDANATLQLTKPFFLQMLTGGAGAKDLLLSDQTKIEGSRIDLGRFFALLDKAPGNFPIVTR
jgi:alkyl sulfatase BDS1-like metallo-beta-lactamase superfamily hydrolase